MSILEKLADKSVVSIELNEDKKTLNVMEMCDAYYIIDLTKPEVKQLIDELTVLYEQMK